MTDTELARAAAKQMNDTFSSQGLFGSFWGRPPLWVGPVISRILMLTGFEDVTYLTSQADEDDNENGQRSARVVAFSREALVIAEVTDARNDNPTITVHALPRRTLASIEATDNTTNLLSDNSGWNTWPGSYALALNYSDGTKLTLPLRRFPTSEEMYALEALRPSLLADLAAV